MTRCAGVFACLLALSPGALAAAEGMNRVALMAVGSDSDAMGFAARALEPAQRLQVKIERVARRSSFTLTLDGMLVDSFTTSPGGTFEAVYESDPKGSHRSLPAGVLPSKVKLVEVQSATGEVVLRGAFGSPKETIERVFALDPTAVDPDAKGEVAIEIEKEDGAITEQSFELQVEGLAPSTSYKLFADGLDITTFATDATGKASLAFSSSPEAGQQPLPPSLASLETLKLVEVKTLDGQLVLSGTFGAPAGNTIVLTSTGIIANAAGTAELSAGGLRIQVSSLTPLNVFLVRVDGKLAGAINTDSTGSGLLDLASTPSGGCVGQLPSSISLGTAKLVEVVNEAGMFVLTGMFP